MGLIGRARRICLRPEAEWAAIAGETTTTGALIAGYVLPLAAASAFAGFVGGSLVGHTVAAAGTFRVPIGAGIAFAAFRLVWAVVGVVVLSLLIDALAPIFGGSRSSKQALKLAAYSCTPAWLAGLLTVTPMLGMLAFFGALYGPYLLYLGLAPLMKCPGGRALGYAAAVVACAAAIAVAVGATGRIID